MILFNPRFASADPVYFVRPATTLTTQGAPKKSYAASGTPVSASVQPKRMWRTEPNGAVRSFTVYNVYLLTDPSGLAASGVQTDDGFKWSNLILACQGPAFAVGGVDKLWKAECLAVG